MTQPTDFTPDVSTELQADQNRLRLAVDRITTFIQTDNANGTCRVFEIGDILLEYDDKKRSLLHNAVVVSKICQKSFLYSCAQVARTFPTGSVARETVQAHYAKRGSTFVREAARLDDAAIALAMLEEAYLGSWSTRRMEQEVKQKLPARRGRRRRAIELCVIGKPIGLDGDKLIIQVNRTSLREVLDRLEFLDADEYMIVLELPR